MNTTFSQVSNQIGNVTLPVPALQTVEFCSGMDMSFVDTLGQEIIRIANISIGVLVACAVLVVLWNCIVIWLQWRRLSQATDVVRASWGQNDATAMTSSTGEKGPRSQPSMQITHASLMTLNVQMQHPLAWRIVNLLTRVFKLSPTGPARDRLAWFLAFIFHPSALTCLVVGITGILLVCIQLIALRPIQERLARETDALTAHVTNAIGSAINTALAGESKRYATAVNAALTTVRTTLDTQLFAWIDTASGGLNATVVAYYAEIQSGVNTAFGTNSTTPSPLFGAAANQFLDCVLGSKINTLQAGISFLKANLRITLPTVPDDVLLLSPALLSDVSQPVADAAVGSDGDDGGILGALLDRYLAALRAELIMFAVILGVWFLIVLLGLGVVAWDAWRARRHTRASVTSPAPSPSTSPVKDRSEPAPMSEKSRT